MTMLLALIVALVCTYFVISARPHDGEDLPRALLVVIAVLLLFWVLGHFGMVGLPVRRSGE